MNGGLPGFFPSTEMPDARWWEALWPDPAGVLAAVGLAPGLEAIDLCSGDGWFTLPLAKMACHVTAIDIDRDLLETARRRLAQSGITNCDFVIGDAYDIGKLVHRPADFVFLANAFHGVPDRPRLVRAIGTTLRPSGRLAILNWHRRPREETTVLGESRGPRTESRVSPEQTILEVEAGGLKRAKLIELPPYHYGAVFEQSSS
jgi:SAM-dependent methyltransferase